MQAPIAQAAAISAVKQADLIVDGLIGYSLAGPPRDDAADLIRWSNSRPTPVLALDVPSGLDAASGVIFEPAIQATATMALALPKQGLLAPGVEALVGELYLADISVPLALYAGPTLEIELGPLFAESEIIRLR